MSTSPLKQVLIQKALIKTSFEQQDWEALQGLAHQVKDTAGSLGFPEYTAHAKHLEMALRNQETDAISALLGVF